MTVSFRKYKRSLSAGIEQTLDVPPSNFVAVAGGSGVFTISPDGQNPCDIEAGVGIPFPEQFTKLRMVSDTSQDVELYVGTGEIQDNRLVGKVDVSGGINLAANTLDAYGATTVGTTAAQIRPANSSRASCLVVNNHASNILYVGDASVTASNGMPVNPGASMTVTWTDAIYGIADAAGTDVRFMDEGV